MHQHVHSHTHTSLIDSLNFGIFIRHTCMRTHYAISFHAMTFDRWNTSRGEYRALYPVKGANFYLYLCWKVFILHNCHPVEWSQNKIDQLKLVDNDSIYTCLCNFLSIGGLFHGIWLVSAATSCKYTWQVSIFKAQHCFQAPQCVKWMMGDDGAMSWPTWILAKLKNVHWPRRQMIILIDLVDWLLGFEFCCQTG